MHQAWCRKKFTRTGFIGEVACTSLVFNFQFTFNCSYLGTLRDSHNSFQLVPHGANPVPPLPHWVPWSWGRSPWGEEEEGSCSRRESDTSSGTLSGAAQEVTHVQPGALFVPHNHSHKWDRDKSCDPRGCEPKDLLTPLKRWC